MNTVNDGYRQLAAAVINLAIKDREDAMRRIELDPKNKQAKELLVDCDEFFDSVWFEELLDVSGLEIDIEEVKKRIYENQRIS